LLARTADARDRRLAVLRLTARGARANAVRQGTVEAAVSERSTVSAIVIASPRGGSWSGSQLNWNAR
jgi:hypothetical protein